MKRSERRSMYLNGRGDSACLERRWRAARMEVSSWMSGAVTTVVVRRQPLADAQAGDARWMSASSVPAPAASTRCQPGERRAALRGLIPQALRN